MTKKDRATANDPAELEPAVALAALLTELRGLRADLAVAPGVPIVAPIFKGSLPEELRDFVQQELFDSRYQLPSAGPTFLLLTVHPVRGTGIDLRLELNGQYVIWEAELRFGGWRLAPAR